IIVVNRSSPGLERNPRFRRSTTALPAATTGALSATDLSTGGSITSAAAATAATRCLRGSDEDLRRAHVLNVGQIPNTLLSGNSAQIDCSIRKPRGRLIQQRVRSASTAATPFTPCLTGSRSVRLTLLLSCHERKDCRCKQEQRRTS